MDVIDNLLFLYLAVLVINLGVAGVLWRQNQTPHHQALVLTWAGMVVSCLLQGATLDSGTFWIAMGFGTTVLGTFPAGIVLASSVGQQQPSRALMAAWLGAMALAAVSTSLGAPFWVVTLPIALTVAAPILLAVANGVWYRRAELTPAGWLLYFSASFLALHQLDFPFLRMLPETAAFGFTVALLALTTMAITAPAVLLEKSTAERVQAEEYNRMQSAFFANVSHELRTPLTLILSPLEALLHDPTIELPAVARGYLSSMQRSTARLLRLINDLLDLAKVDAGKVSLRYEQTDLEAFSRPIVASFGSLAEAKRITLDFVAEPTEALHVDPERMDTVLQNLMANAMKFTPDGGRVTVRIRNQPTEVWLEVQDSGIGIAAKDQEVIFERFGQADRSITQRFGGTGIGLALVKDLVQLHGGTVTVESALGQGR